MHVQNDVNMGPQQAESLGNLIIVTFINFQFHLFLTKVRACSQDPDKVLDSYLTHNAIQLFLILATLSMALLR